MHVAETGPREPAPVASEQIIQMPLGLLGFEQFKRYRLLAKPEEAPFLWLQVVDDPNLAFLVISPFVARPDYGPDLAPEDVAYLGLLKPEDALIFNIVTVRPGAPATVNLKGPIVLHRQRRLAKQVIPLNAAQYDLRHPLT